MLASTEERLRELRRRLQSYNHSHTRIEVLSDMIGVYYLNLKISELSDSLTDAELICSIDRLSTVCDQIFKLGKQSKLNEIRSVLGIYL